MPFLFSSRIKNKYIPSSIRIKGKWNNIDYLLWLIPIFLVFISGLLIASTQRQANYADWYNHWITGGIGMLIAFALSLIPLERIKPCLIPIYIITLSSLVAVKFFGTSALGAQRWLSIAGFNVQPSELAKLTAIITLASVLENFRIENPIDLIRPVSVIVLPWMFVFIQPDLGTSLVFAAILLSMLYWNGMPLEWILLILSVLFTAIFSGIVPWVLWIWIPLIGCIAYRSFLYKWRAYLISVIFHIAIAFATPWFWTNVLRDYQRDRLVLFLDPGQDPLGGGYHLLQSIVGIGSGGLWGTGILNGQLTKLRFIPEQHTDFIFSALGEEMGFIGTIIVLFLFFLLTIRLLKLAKNARTDFESLIVIGVLTMFIFQVIVNINMTIGLGPVTGIPLPFMSYGRTALLVNFISLGLCLSVARRKYAAIKNW